MEQIVTDTDKRGLVETARQLALTHQIEQNPPRQPDLLQRLPELASRLADAHRAFAQGAEELSLSYPAEWMLDNHYLILQALRQIGEDLPPRYYRELPKLAAGDPLAGQPRIYALARAFLLHDDGQFDGERLARLVGVYQQDQVLTMGELWALPIMLRMVLLESLVQATSSILGQADPTALAIAMPGFRPYHYRPENHDIVAHTIQSLRLIDSQDWADMFEQTSLVHRVLGDDPVGLYLHMDFATRNQYRAEVETIGRGSGVAEVAIAQYVVDQACSAFQSHRPSATSSNSSDGGVPLDPWANLSMPRECHVGYYLLDLGRQQVEAYCQFRPNRAIRFYRALFGGATLYHLGAIILVTLLILGAAVVYAGGALWSRVLVALLMAVPALTLAVDLVNQTVTRLLPPRILPKLDFEAGIPPSCATMVVIPALIAHVADVESLFVQLEQHYLCNPDPNRNLTFALLSDFADAPDGVRPEDEELLTVARCCLDKLNQRYPTAPFYFFHRRRCWNASEKTWMGWERKRGKLHEFNQLLRQEKATTYDVQLGNLARLPQVRYVITLDADTVIPRDTAHHLVGTLAHPLNQARFDPKTGKVCAGYTILQPRTAIKPTSANRSLFTRVFGGSVGIDLYTLAVSDVYQDLFGTGIYVGKGIYDVDAFERSLVGRVPENTLLSHDLFEGIHGRVGLVTDIVLYEEYPPHYLAGVRRAHRWVRGDWQLLPWLGWRVPFAGGSQPNALSLIDRWKIFDNLRRSLLAPALLALYVAGWTVLPGSPLVWTLLAALTPGLALLSALLRALLQRITRAARSSARRSAQSTVQGQALRWLLFQAFLPYEALLFSDAIATTLFRLFIRRRNLLQWTTAARTVRLFGDELSAATTIRHMLPAQLLTLAIAVLVLLVAPVRIWLALPFLVIWLLAWRIAYWISRPTIVTEAPLTAAEQQELRRLARHTWLFYEHFVGPTDNWLPPDHFQESPRGQVAHRTSPTNVGMYLLAVLAAHDLGYIGLLDLAARLRSTFDTLGRLERYRGHFLNWIDTRTLEPLPPRYVSTVDSGNLLATLIALKQGCLAQARQAVWSWERWSGLLDTLALLDHALEPLADDVESPDDVLRTIVDQVQQQVLGVQTEWESWYPLLVRLSTVDREKLDQGLLALVEGNVAAFDSELLQRCRIYVERIHHNLDACLREVDRLQPWLASLAQPPSLVVGDTVSPPLHTAWQTLVASFPIGPPLDEIGAICATGRETLGNLRTQIKMASADPSAVEAALKWCTAFSDELNLAQETADALLAGFSTLAGEIDRWLVEMDFGFLFSGQREVFHIGYNVDAGLLDRNYYDLLASEARIASLVAIAKNDVPQSHWLHLGRPLTTVASGSQALLSWSGTMFEYLMPPLVLRQYQDTLLDTTTYAIIDHQILYGRDRRQPWGVSESGFYTFDAAMSYQYRAFGVPGLGFKRGLAEDYVVAPYASLLALPFRPHAVLENMRALHGLGMWGRYGYYESVDFTPSRLLFGQEFAIVREYMAHHQGMVLLAVNNLLNDDIMVERFHAEPMIQSVDLLLQEQVPQGAPLQYPNQQEAIESRPALRAVTADSWRVPNHTPLPLAHYLSNGQYGLLVTNAGSGYSRWRDFNLTRWRADTTLDDWGCWLYIQDMESGALWSAGIQPSGVWPEHSEIHFAPHQVEFRRRDQGITLHMAITVAPEDDVEIRRIHLTNESDQPRRLRLTTYGEVVLGPAGADLRHPAFGKLFVESEYHADFNALLFRRRQRSANEELCFLAHALVVEADVAETGAYESDRARFLGRLGSTRQPAALTNANGSAWLTGTVGATLDPIMALGQEVVLEPHGSAQLAIMTVTAGSRDTLLNLVRRYCNWSTIERTFTRARNAAEQEMRALDLSSAQLEQYQQLLSLLFYPHVALRSDPAILGANHLGQDGLWAFGISGDYPILLVRVKDENEGDLALEALRAHLYWRRHGLMIDLVLLNQQESNYGQPMQGFLHHLIERLDSSNLINQRGGIFILREDQMGEAERILLQSVARVVLDGARDLSQQLSTLLNQPTTLPPLEPALRPDDFPDESQPLPRPTDLQFDNGLGGFSPDGNEYLLYLQPPSAGGLPTPAPWINVIANADFGSLASESGGGYTWSENSGENRLTPWRNDPVSDRPAEALYLRDEETVELWSPMPQPAPDDLPYLVRHGVGYTQYEHHSRGLLQQTRLFVAADAPVKIVHLRLENNSARPRRLTATYYAEWTLGVDRESAQLTVVPEYDDGTHALLARNPYSLDFGQRVAFLSCSRQPHGLTADRAEFLGRLGSLARPAALFRVGLESRVQPGQDPCAVLQLHIDLAPGASEELYFLLGQGSNRDEALALVQRFQSPGAVESAWQAVEAQWSTILGTVLVETPDRAMNLLLNRWLLYQTLSCRIWGRSALYQSSGAYGFRDQLQDVMALVHTRPELARQQILRAARYQFEAGDVLHWWHPPAGRGVRTRISDDLLWLPYVTAHYVQVTGDEAILQQEVPFLRGEPLGKDEDERYSQFSPTERGYSLFEHCRRALEKGTTAGPHGIPLIGAGDWNDGMNRVGHEGRGESIWLGWFLHATLNSFAALCRRLGQETLASRYQEQAEPIRQAVETYGWDGEWYRRASYDDGTPLGSKLNRECRIDSIAQSWAVLSGAGEPGRAEQAMHAVLEQLIKLDDRLILLFTPPFDKTARDPGYIKGYLPGVRENGGQYTHAALWSIWAYAELGQGDLAESLFRLINPIYRADTAEKVEKYKVEPYVISADVYGAPPHVGRGGWTWYTGSSGWMYRLGVEAILGLQRENETLLLRPCIPHSWPGYNMTYRYGKSEYRIEVSNPHGLNRGTVQVTLDGAPVEDGRIPLVDDGGDHRVFATIDT